MDKQHLWLDFRILLILCVVLLPFGLLAIAFYKLGYPVWIIGIVAVLFLIFDYQLAIKKTISHVNAIELSGETEAEQEVLDLVDEMATELNVKMPTVYVADLGGPNAFATGRKGNGHIVLSNELIQTITKEELKAVIAHEISHLKSRDIIPIALVQGVGYFVGLLVFEASLLLVKQNRNKVDSRYILIEKIQNIFTLFSRPLSRQREYVADYDAANALGSGQHLHDALLKISQVPQKTPKTTAQLCIYNKTASFFEKVTATHPSLEERLDKLNEY